MTNRKKLEEITVMRALAIILIIVCHVSIFTKPGIFYEAFYQSAFYTAPIGLCMFFFVSGFLLYYNYKSVESINKALNFYYKRLKRIYPLYWAALLSFIPLIIYIQSLVVTNYSTWELPTYVANFLGIQAFIFAQVNQTHFWFISVIILYYLLYPIIIYPKKLVNMVSLSIIFFLIAYIINLKFNLIDIRFFKYYWIFLIGIIICWIKYNKKQLFSKNYKDYLILLALIPLLAIIPEKYYQTYYLFIGIISSVIAYVLLNTLFENNALNKKLKSNKLYRLLAAISLGSYAIYLFHPTILYTSNIILNYFNVSPFYFNLIVILVVIPLIFIVGYYIQIFEFKLLTKITFPRIKSKIKEESDVLIITKTKKN